MCKVEYWLIKGHLTSDLRDRDLVGTRTLGGNIHVKCEKLSWIVGGGCCLQNKSNSNDTHFSVANS